MNAGKKRKLIRPGTLAAISLLCGMGVPLNRAMKEVEIEELISRPAANKLLSLYKEMFKKGLDNDTHIIMHRSLFPSWLDLDASAVQEQPEGWEYIGRFPFGEWSQVTE